MNADIRRKLEMGYRALTFSQAHPDSSAGFATALSRLEVLIGRADVLATRQRAGVIAERTATSRKRDLRAMVHRSMLHHLARVSEAASTEQPELARKFQLHRQNASYQAFRTATRAMIDEAQAQKELLVRHGLSEPLLESLVQSMAQFDEAIQQGAAGRREHVGTSAELAVVVQEMLQVVNVMDGLNRFRFAHDAELLAAWESASNIFGPSQGPGAAAAPDDSATPPAPAAGGSPADPEQIRPAA